jgi:DNA-binding NarL/FixJ family response regulator
LTSDNNTFWWVRSVPSRQANRFSTPRSTARMLQRLRERPQKGPLAALTDQERRILELIGDGLTNRQIGERLFLAEKTIKNYVSNLFTKLDMHRRTQAAAFITQLKANESRTSPDE